MTGRQRALLLFLLTAGVYANSVGSGFHFDDKHSIVDNPAISSLSHIPEYLVEAGEFSGDPDIDMYRPLLLVTYALNHAVGGLDPLGYHVVNVVLHGLFVLLVALIASRLCGGHAGAWWMAAILAVHPIQSQAVNYISSRSGILAALGVLGAFWFAAAKPTTQVWQPLAAAGSLLLGLLGKSTALITAPLIAVHEWGRRKAEGQSRQQVVMWSLLAGVCVVYLAAARWSGFLSPALDGFVRPLSVQALTQSKALAYYVYLLVSPIHLSVSHAFTLSHSVDAAVLLAAMATASLLAVTLRAWRRGDLAGYGVLWFYGGLMLTTIMPLNILISEQRLYLSTAGLVFVGTALSRCHRQPRLGRAMAVVALICLGLLTVQRNRVWQTELSLWTEAEKVSPLDPLVHANLGQAWYDAGDTVRARLAYERARQLDPESAVVWHNLGVLLEQSGQWTEADSCFRRALDLRPDWPETQADLGRLLLNHGQVQAAAALLARAAERRPRVGTLVNLGVAATRLGDRVAAVDAFHRALELEPKHIDARINLASLRLEEAQAMTDPDAWHRALQQVAMRYEELIAETGSTHPAARVNLAGVQTSLGRLDEARRLYEEVIGEHPDYAGGHEGYGRFLLSAGDPVAAARALRRAVQLGSVSLETWQDLGRAEAARGDLEAATKAFQAAAALAPGGVGVIYNLAEVWFARWDQARRTGQTDRLDDLAARTRSAYERVEALAPGYRSTAARLARLP